MTMAPARAVACPACHGASEVVSQHTTCGKALQEVGKLVFSLLVYPGAAEGQAKDAPRGRRWTLDITVYMWVGSLYCLHHAASCKAHAGASSQCSTPERRVLLRSNMPWTSEDLAIAACCCIWYRLLPPNRSTPMPPECSNEEPQCQPSISKEPG
ncbi:hypothetical protein GE09DRAFT_184297 [Coniochaeta sp. 2T2.1]|nr:hypothetical protein GE09DRAFT_184297 [Coniochaeta sp. 2T2.1]